MTSTIAAILSIVVGVLLSVWIVTRASSASAPAAPLVVVVLIVGVLEIALGVGILRFSRVAWSFALALDGVLVTVGFFAIPALVHSRSSLFVLAAPQMALVVTIILLIVTASDFRGRAA